MPRPSHDGPTDYELSILQILWKGFPLSVSEILKRIKKRPKPAYSSLLTIVRLMEKKGYVSHEKKGRAFYYSPVLKEKSHSKKEIKKLADTVFGGSSFELAVNIIKDEKLSADEIQQLKQILEEI